MKIYQKIYERWVDIIEFPSYLDIINGFPHKCLPGIIHKFSASIVWMLLFLVGLLWKVSAASVEPARLSWPMLIFTTD